MEHVPGVRVEKLDCGREPHALSERTDRTSLLRSESSTRPQRAAVVCCGILIISETYPAAQSISRSRGGRERVGVREDKGDETAGREKLRICEQLP